MDTQNPPSSPQNKKLLDLYRDALRTKHYAHRTEDTYIRWIIGRHSETPGLCR